MTFQGDLSELSVADVIQITCQDGKTARLVLHHGEEKAVLYIQKGQLVHAIMGDLQGEEVVFVLLNWDDGTFISKADIESTDRSISRSVTEILLEGASRLDEEDTHQWDDLYEKTTPQRVQSLEGIGSKYARKASLADYLKIDGVLGAVKVAGDGIVIEHEFKGDFERAGAVISYVGVSATKIISGLHLSEFSYGLVEIGEDSAPLMILPTGADFIGLVLVKNISPTHIVAKLKKG